MSNAMYTTSGTTEVLPPDSGIGQLAASEQAQRVGASQVLLEAVMRGVDQIRPWNFRDAHADVFRPLGFSASKAVGIWNSWHDGNPPRLESQTSWSLGVNKNINTMRKIAATDAGAPYNLFAGYGIRHFGRYRSRDLLEQLASPISRSPQAVVQSALIDPRNTLLYPRSESSKAGVVKPVYVEAGSLCETAAVLSKVSQNFGPVKRWLLFSHSSLKGIYLAPGVRIDKLQLRNHPQSIELIRESLASDAQIILSSCYSGYEDKEQDLSVARLLAQLTGATVVAPDFLTRGISRLSTPSTIRFKRYIRSTRAPVYAGNVVSVPAIKKVRIPAT